MNKGNLIIITVLFLSSCIASRQSLTNNNEPIPRDLKLLYEYTSTSDTLKDCILIEYKALDLKEAQQGQIINIRLNDELIFMGDFKKYDFQFEVFKDSFLVISITGGEFGAYGPDVFRRDNVLILDLKSSLMCQANLNNVFITRSQEYLLKTYKQSSMYYAIDRINLQELKVLLLDHNSNIKVIPAKLVIKPFKCL